MAHGLGLLSLRGFLGMGAAKPNAYGTILDAINLLLILLVFNLLLLLDGNLLIERLDLAEELVLNVRCLLVFLQFLEVAYVLFLQYLQFILAALNIIHQPRSMLLQLQLLFLLVLSRGPASTTLRVTLEHAGRGSGLA